MVSRTAAHDTGSVQRPIIALFGPTGVGKTAIAVALAAAAARRAGSVPLP